MRRFLIAFLVLCVAVPAVALAADTDPKKRITAADQAKAQSLLLRRTDFVAGWKKVPATPDSDATCPGFNPSEADLTLTGEAEANFEHTNGLPTVYSASEVWASKADALTSWARTAKPAVARCLAHFLREGMADAPGAKLTIVSQGRFAFPKYAQRSIALRVVAKLTVTKAGEAPVTVPLTVHLIGLGHGRGDVALMTMAFGSGVPLAELRSFAKLSAARLAAAKL